jgi:hypothetical protein
MAVGAVAFVDPGADDDETTNRYWLAGTTTPPTIA